MWSYYGAKTRIAKRYPEPVYDTIIEPFAGTAKYSLLYHDRNIILIDKYEVIIRIWKWLQLCSPGDINGLPRFKKGQNINSITYDCEEQRFLVGFLIGFGFPHPRQSAKLRLRDRPEVYDKSVKFIADNLWKIKHWEIKHGDYTDAPDIEATYFIDAPYQHGGHKYKVSNKKLDFKALSAWCQSRKGQTIVCENNKADWLPFRKFATHEGMSGTQHEMIWTNTPSAKISLPISKPLQTSFEFMPAALPATTPQPLKISQVDGLQQIELPLEVETIQVKPTHNPDAHLYGYIATDKTDRQRMGRKIDALIEKLNGLQVAERNALIKAVNAKFPPPPLTGVNGEK